MKPQIKLDREGFRQLRNAPGVVADLERRAERIAQAAGEGVVVKPSETGGSRARVAVVTESFSARYRQARDLTLTRSIDAGGR